MCPTMVTPKVIFAHQVSNEKNPGWLGYIGDYTTQLYRDYFWTIIRIPINQPV